MVHYVYVVGSPDNNFTPLKIGIADDVNKRLSSLQTGCPIELVALAAFAFRGKAAAATAESMAHMHFARRRARGEWVAVPFWEIERYLLDLKVEYKGRFGPERDTAKHCFSNSHLYKSLWTQRRQAAPPNRK